MGITAEGDQGATEQGPAGRSRHHLSARRTNGAANVGQMGGTKTMRANGGRNSAITLVA